MTATSNNFMPANRNRQSFIDTVIRSPAAVKAHDKQAWLSLFATYNIVEDPVGSKAHISGGFDSISGTRGNAALARFYDTYIEPNDIIFHVERDIVCGYHVVRDIFLQIQMSPAVSIDVPMHALYELIEENGELRIVRLAAHWELLPMIKQLLGKGISSTGVLCRLGWRMLTIQGVSGIIGFTRALSGIDATGKDCVQMFVKALNNKQLALAQAQFSDDHAGIEFPHGEVSLSLNQLINTFNGSLSVSKLIAAGYVCSCSCHIDNNGVISSGVAFFEFNARNKKIALVRFYFEPAIAP